MGALEDYWAAGGYSERLSTTRSRARRTSSSPSRSRLARLAQPEMTLANCWQPWAHTDHTTVMRLSHADGRTNRQTRSRRSSVDTILCGQRPRKHGRTGALFRTHRGHRG